MNCALLQFKITIFQSAFGTEANRFHDVYDDIMNIILDLKTIMNLYNLTKVGYLIDSSISKWHDPSFNPDILNNTGLQNQTSDNIFFFEFMLGVILEFAVVNAPYLAHFDDLSAW